MELRPFFLPFLICSAPAVGGEGYGSAAPLGPDYQTTYTMPSAMNWQQYQLDQWRKYQARHDAEVARERALIERLNAEALRNLPLRPAFNAAEAPSQRPPAPGPTHPPVMREFKGEFEEIVKAYVRAHSEKSGAFVLDDGTTGKRYRLRLVAIHAERIRLLSPGQTVGSADFDAFDGAKAAYGLEFFLAKDESAWRVDKVILHAVNGKPRYAYDKDNRIVAAPTPPVPRPSAPAHLSAEIAVKLPSGKGTLFAGQTGALAVKISNAGPGAAYAIRLSLDPQSPIAGLSVPAEASFGDLPAGQSVSKEVPVSAAEDAPSAKAGLRLSISEGNGFDTEPVLVEFGLRASGPPKLELSGITLGGKGVVTAGEPTPLSVRVRNAGKGPAYDVVALLDLGSKDLFMSGEPSVPMGTLEAGQSKTAAFEFFANKRFRSGQTLPVSLTLTESSGKHGLAGRPLNLVLGEIAPSVTVLAGAENSSAAATPEAAPEPEDVDSPPKTRTPRNPDAYAVLVGIEKYRDLPGADFAARDARIMQAYLTQAMGFDPKNVVLLQDDRASLTDMATYLGPWLKDRVTAKSRVFVYYAGHGAPDPRTGRAYLIPYDGDPAYADTKAFPLQRLYDALAELPTDDVTVALDACFSGAGGRSVLAKGARPLVSTVAAPRVPPNTIVLAAAESDQISTDNPDAQHGMLTYFLLKGLHGAADAGADGRVTTRRLFEYLGPAVEREARNRHVEQVPVLSPPLATLGKRGDRAWLLKK